MISTHPQTLSAGSIDDLWRKGLHNVMCYGDKVFPRDMATKELRGMTLHLTDPQANILTHKYRNAQYRFSCAEFLYLWLGLNDNSIMAFNKNIGQFSDDGYTFTGAYGPRLVTQLPWIIQQLRKDRQTRQAVLTIWEREPGPSKDVPCTVLMQFFARDSRLEMVTYMRSNDLWLGFPYDLFNFTMIQNAVAAFLGLELGSYTHMVGSLHLYSQHWEGARAVLKDPSKTLRVRSRRLTMPMPRQVARYYWECAEHSKQAAAERLNNDPSFRQLSGTAWEDLFDGITGYGFFSNSPYQQIRNWKAADDNS